MRPCISSSTRHRTRSRRRRAHHPPRGPAMRAYAPLPNGSRRAHHRCARLGGRVQRPRAYWPRKPGPRRAPLAALRFAGDLRVAGARARGNCTQGLPDTLLERGASDIERQIQPDSRRFHEAHNVLDSVYEIRIPGGNLSPRETCAQIVEQRVSVVAQENGADAPLGGGDQDNAQRARARGVVYGSILPSGAEIGGRHA